MGEPTQGEHIAVLNATMQRLDKSINNLSDNLEQNYLRKETYVSDQKAVWANIKQHQGWITWATRLVIGAVLMGILGLYVSKASGVI